MPTSIAVKEDTVEMLKQIQRTLQTSTHDETIKKLILHAKKPQRSFFGKLKTKKEFVREELDRFA